MHKKLLAAIALALALPLAFAGVAWAHGFTTTPPSRAYNCSTGLVKNCGDIQYEPQSVEGPKGFPSSGPADGTICAGGIARFAQLDDPRGGAWPATAVTGGARFTFNWTLRAVHATTSFRYFATKNGWNPASTLTRAALDATPFLTVNYNGTRPPTTVTHTGTLPTGKTGRGMILAVWDIADTGNAFYQCSDVTWS